VRPVRLVWSRYSGRWVLSTLPAGLWCLTPATASHRIVTVESAREDYGVTVPARGGK